MKLCECNGCTNKQFGGGYCGFHQWMRADKKPKASGKVTRIKFRSDKRAAEEREYSIERIKFLSLPENQFCAVYPWLPADQVHHKRGRIGKLLLDKKHWLAVSDAGHKKIEANPAWAHEMKFSEKRGS